MSISAKVDLTDAAARRIAAILAGEPGKSALRVSVEGGGCSGFSYNSTSSSTSATDDDRRHRAGRRDRSDRRVSLDYMGGSEIDFVDDLIGPVIPDQEPERGRLLRLRHQFFRSMTHTARTCR